MSMQCSMSAGVTYKSKYVKGAIPNSDGGARHGPRSQPPLLAFGGRDAPWGLLALGI